MNGPVAAAVAIVAAYLVGAIPWGYLFGRWFGGVDLRTVGSGGTGATNALRAVGPKVSAGVLVLDLLKGLVPVLLVRWLGAPDWLTAAVAVATVAGHCWSPYIGFAGGKGVATGAGAAIALFPPVILVLPVIAAIVWATRYVSLGSMVGSILATAGTAFAAATGRAPWAYAVAVAAMTAIIVYQHRGNIARLKAGTERRFGERLAG